MIASAATAGAIVGLGARHGAALLPFTIAGRSIVGAAPAAAASMAGVALHVVWMIVWGACFTLVAAPLRGARLFIGAVVFALVVWGISTYAAPGVNPVFRVAALTTVQMIVAYALLAVALVIGMRLALPTYES